MRQPSIDGGLDQVRRDEGERDRHIDLPHTAALTCGNAFGVDSGIGNQFVEPATPRAIEATKVARFSERIGRASCDVPDSGMDCAADVLGCS
jgi:hypothetical protein